MRAEELRTLLEEAGLSDVVSDSRREFLLEFLVGREDSEVATESTRDPALRLARLLEGAASALEANPDRAALFHEAFVCRRAADGFRDPASPLSELRHYFSLAADGVIGERPAEVAMFLRDLPPSVLEL